MCAVFLLGRRLYAFLERLVSDDVRAGARCNGTFSETCEIPRLNAKKSLMNPSQYFFSYRILNFVTPIIESVRTPAGITPYPTGRPSFGAASQALRARLRSHRPSGTKAIRPSKGLALSGPSLFCVGNIPGQEGAERFAAVNQEAGITRFARPSALIPFLA